MNKENKARLEVIKEIADKAFIQARKDAEKIAKQTGTKLVTLETIKLSNKIDK